LPTAIGGYDVANLDVAEKYLGPFGKLAREGNTMILPANLINVSSMVTPSMATLRQTGGREQQVS